MIAELGINHNGDLDTARQLIEAAHHANAWGVKFQYRNLSRTYGSSLAEIGDEIVFANISRSHLGPDEIIELATYARSLGLSVGSSFFNEQDIADLAEYRFDFYKVPSSELTNLPLFGRLFDMGGLVLASTGMSNEDEVEKLRDTFGKNENLVVFHCVSNYPTDSLNSRLGYISWLKSLFGRRVGYSSHDRDWEVCLLALGLGIEFMERHLTLDKLAVGTDHSSSSEPDEFLRLVMFAREHSRIMAGNERRRMNQGERMNRQNLGRSLYLKETAQIGDVVELENVSYVSPQLGISWMDWSQLGHLPLAEKVKAGAPLLKRHFDLTPAAEISKGVIDWAVANKISLPVRMHDFENVRAVFGLGDHEFHLSYQEVKDLQPNQYRMSGANYSVHLPDYVANDFLIDPFSRNPEIQDLSLTVFEKVADFSEALALESGNVVPVVCSLSNEELTREDFYSSVEVLFQSLRRSGVEFTLQWLPPVAWYFGGSMPLQRVNSAEDIGLILASKIPITMDISHLLMGENAGWYSSSEVFEQLKPSIAHLHISGAQGLDGEGTAFDFSNPAERELLDSIFLAPDYLAHSKVIEVWQGHLDDFSGFTVALETLHSRYANG